MAPPAKGAEYKQVTVLFADVVGSMDIAAAVDAERLREIIAELVNRTAAVVERYGGTVHQFTGDGIMAMFGAPMALEDHAIRACLAGLGIQDHCQRLAQRVASSDGVDLRLRVGLNSGQVITGEIGSGPFGYTAIGAQVGLAQRMESVAPPGGVMLSESTARLVERAAVLGEPQMVTIKGASAPVPVRQLLGVAAHPGRIGRSETTLVGRQWEMDRLVGFLDRSIGGKGCVVCVTGPAGIGKSRLIDEVATIARTRGVEVFSTFGESHASDIPFHAVARLLRAVAGVSGLADDAARERVRAQVRDADPQDLLLLDDLLGIAGATLAQTGVDPDARRTRLIALINAMSLARVQPAVYVIEDAHWVDEVSESMLAEFLSVIPQTPSMVLISYRPEYCGALSQVPSGQTIAVSPLSNSETSALLSELVGTDPSVDRVVALIAGRAAGNPFFAQEIVRELAQRGAVEGERGRYVCRTGVVEIQVPATLQATITARIDRLQPAAKQTLSAAAVIGSRFSPDLLRTALQIEPALEDLLVSELIDHVVFTERDQYTFRHPLIRAVAYESQLKSDRAQVHRRLAETIAARDAISVDKYAALIAEHLEAAGDWHAAYDWHMRAGAWSSVRDSAAARLSWERARQIADELPADDMDRLVMRILPRAALCCTAWRVDLDISDSDFEELRRLCAEAGDTASLAIGMTGLIGEHIVHGRESQASGLKSEQLALIESLRDPMPAPGLRHGVSLLVAGAQDAIALTNVAVAERLGRAAVIHGGGLAASELLARALLGQDRTAEAEDVLRSFNPHQMDELDLVRWGLARIANLHWSMGDAQSADEVLHLLRERVTRHPLTLFVDGVESAARAFENELTAAAELSERVLADPKAPQLRLRGQHSVARSRWP